MELRRRDILGFYTPMSPIFDQEPSGLPQTLESLCVAPSGQRQPLVRLPANLNFVGAAPQNHAHCQKTGYRTHGHS